MKLQKSRIVIIGFGHVGRGVLEATQESPDMEVAGIVELPHMIEVVKEKVKNIPVTNDI